MRSGERKYINITVSRLCQMKKIIMIIIMVRLSMMMLNNEHVFFVEILWGQLPFQFYRVTIVFKSYTLKSKSFKAPAFWKYSSELTPEASCEPYLPSVCGCAPSGCVCFWRHYPLPSGRDCGTWRKIEIHLRESQSKMTFPEIGIKTVYWLVHQQWELKFTRTCACQFSWTPCSDEEDAAGFSCAASTSASLAYEHWLYPFSYLW